MAATYFTDAGTFLIESLFGLYILTIMLRFLFQWLRADFYNPISQFVVKATAPLLRPLRRWIPGVGGIDMAAVILMLTLQGIEIWVVYVMRGYHPSLGGLLLSSTAEILRLLVYVFLIAVFARVIVSWMNPDAYNPAIVLLDTLSEPLLAPARRLLPPLGGLDLSPVVVLIALQMVLMLFIAPLMDLGHSLL
ncbi:MAG: YggT family protein [Gammaproteobacteria bacterium]